MAEVVALLQDADARPARHHRQSGRRQGGAAAGRGAARRDDPYLVVAADKGTATFSDIANGVSRDYGFWLDDAFASGGSAGYDHKKMGITARGAWEMREAAFPRARHRHPDPGFHLRRRRRHVGRRVRQRHAAVAAHQAAGGLQPPAHLRRSGSRSGGELRGAQAAVRPAALVLERLRRQADLRGGGIFERKAKSIKLSPEVQRALRHRQGAGDAGRADPAPAEGGGRPAVLRRHRHLREGQRREPTPRSATAPTTRCASTATELRAKVVGEGANLGVTQRGRIEAALNGGTHQHRRDRQFRRRRHLRPRGQHQDPAERGGRGRRPDA